MLAGIKTPFALFGALMGGNLSYYTAPLLFDGSKTLSQLLAFTFDGLVADTVGRPPGQPPSWEAESILDSVLRRSDRDLNAASATLSPRELEFDARMKALVGDGAGGAGAGEGGVLSPEDKEAELKWLAGKNSLKISSVVVCKPQSAGEKCVFSILFVPTISWHPESPRKRTQNSIGIFCAFFLRVTTLFIFSRVGKILGH